MGLPRARPGRGDGGAREHPDLRGDLPCPVRDAGARSRPHFLMVRVAVRLLDPYRGLGSAAALADTSAALHSTCKRAFHPGEAGRGSAFSPPSGDLPRLRTSQPLPPRTRTGGSSFFIFHSAHRPLREARCEKMTLALPTKK